ncbi:MAG TPA: hypothetical protein VIK60_15035 [Vicinamibacterales bacterium]
MFLKHFYSTDHKIIGLLYGFTSLFFLLVPGIPQPVWFTPTRTGEWEIACSQLCGLGHYRMRGFYTIQTQAEYEAWLASEAALLAAQ